jgi:catechol 2,3-dioxygenase-like lactoylglutathione lyase family enzyme
MAEMQADSGVPVSPAAQQVGIELTDAELAGARLTGAETAGAELAEAGAAEEYELASYQSSSWPFTEDPPPTGAIHHIELWVPNLDKAITSFGWLLTALGYRMFQDWPGGRSWRAGHSYIVVEQSPARTASRHDRCRPGLNHLAFHVETRELLDKLTDEAQLHGWKLMFSDQHPFAGGPQHYAAYLENSDGYEVELVAH